MTQSGSASLNRYEYSSTPIQADQATKIDIKLSECYYRLE